MALGQGRAGRGLRPWAPPAPGGNVSWPLENWHSLLTAHQKRDHCHPELSLQTRADTQNSHHPLMWGPARKDHGSGQAFMERPGEPFRVQEGWQSSQTRKKNETPDLFMKKTTRPFPNPVLVGQGNRQKVSQVCRWHQPKGLARAGHLSAFLWLDWFLHFPSPSVVFKAEEDILGGYNEPSTTGVTPASQHFLWAPCP